MSKDNVFIGVAWPYVNGNLHIGHYAGYLLPCDLSSRYHRLMGKNVLMVSGSDCFGTPITVEADKKKITPKEIVEEYHTKNVDLFKNILGLTYDLYTKTDNPNHIKITQDFFIAMLEKELIFIDETEQFYSPSEDRFLPDRYVVGECPFCGYKDSRSDQCDNCSKLIIQDELVSPRSNLSGEPVELKKTQHYYIDWPKLQPFLAGKVNAGETTIEAAHRELKEETSLEGDSQLIGIFHYIDLDQNNKLLMAKLFFTYLFTNVRGEIVNTNEGRFEWVKYSELKNYIKNPFESMEIFWEEMKIFENFNGTQVIKEIRVKNNTVF